MNIMERLENLERRVEQMVVRGKIHAVDCATKKVRVAYGDNSTTDWIEWKPVRSGHVTIWSPPQVGEGCTVISDGDINLGEVFLGSYHNSMPAPSSSPDDTVMKFPDGTVFTYNMASHKLTLEVAGDTTLDVKGNINAKATGSVSVESEGSASVKAKGKASVESGASCEVKAAGQVLLTGAGIAMNGGGGGSMSCGSDGIKLGGSGSGVVTGAHVCAYTGKPHAACSATVFAAG
ncbi:MAG: phage baseplate assembly protein V [Aeromonas popoffii]|uniref:phage baseplate assembly protein V n=1 Tax=Aeromonas popoffii TaxID=70856 RepID=UPI003F2B8988